MNNFGANFALHATQRFCVVLLAKSDSYDTIHVTNSEGGILTEPSALLRNRKVVGSTPIGGSIINTMATVSCGPRRYKARLSFSD